MKILHFETFVPSKMNREKILHFETFLISEKFYILKLLFSLSFRREKSLHFETFISEEKERE